MRNLEFCALFKETDTTVIGIQRVSADFIFYGHFMPLEHVSLDHTTHNTELWTWHIKIEGATII